MRYGKYHQEELYKMSSEQLMRIILKEQEKKNFILATDSYKLTHHLLYPEGLTELYSYMESRGSSTEIELESSVFFGLQYYLMEYLAGVRITSKDINEANRQSISHFGFDCFNRKMWERILSVHGGKLPLEICAVPEGTVMSLKNVLLTIKNTDPECAALVNPTETLLMKLWYPITVASYSRSIKEIIRKGWLQSSDTSEFTLDYLLHDFGARGVSSEETAKIGAAANMINFKGTDTFVGISMLQEFYSADMPGVSVIASEHSVMCSFGGPDHEFEAYEKIITKVRKECPGAHIISLVSDTYNIYNVCRNILPKLKHLWVGQTNSNGIPIKVVVRPDSGDMFKVLFGDIESQDRDIQLGVFEILAQEFGSYRNAKGYKKLDLSIGILQGDGISKKTIAQLVDLMISLKIDTTSLVVGSGGKLLQAHDRDSLKFAIKATYAKFGDKGIAIQKDPITDHGKKSKKGYLKLVERDGKLQTLEMSDPDFEMSTDILVPVFRDGEILKKWTFDEIRKTAKIS